MKVVISDPKTGKAWQVDKPVPSVMGLKLGDSFDGTLIGLSGYKVQITGGSDKEGFPMRRDMPGTARRRMLLDAGVGYRPEEKGVRKRKSVRGRVVAEDIIQLNLKVIEHGTEPIPKLLGIEEKPKEATEEKK